MNIKGYSGGKGSGSSLEIGKKIVVFNQMSNYFDQKKQKYICIL